MSSVELRARKAVVSEVVLKAWPSTRAKVTTLLQSLDAPKSIGGESGPCGTAAEASGSAAIEAVSADDSTYAGCQQPSSADPLVIRLTVSKLPGSLAPPKSGPTIASLSELKKQ